MEPTAGVGAARPAGVGAARPAGVGATRPAPAAVGQAWGVLAPHNPAHGPPLALHEACVSVGARASSWTPPPHAAVHPFLSRAHFQLRRTEDGEVLVTALSKKNATFLNGKRLQPDCPTPAHPDMENAPYQLAGCAPDDPIIFTVVANKVQALKRPKLSEGYVGFTLTLTPSPHALPSPSWAPVEQDSSDQPLLATSACPSRTTADVASAPRAAAISSGEVFSGVRLLIVPTGLAKVWLDTLGSRVLKLGGALTQELSHATHVVVEKNRRPECELPELAALPRTRWPAIHTEEWISESSKAKQLLADCYLHPDVAPSSLPVDESPRLCSQSSCSLPPVDSPQQHIASSVLPHAREGISPLKIETSCTGLTPAKAIEGGESAWDRGPSASSSSSDAELRSTLEEEARRERVTVKELILRNFRRLHDAYKAGADRGKSASMGASGADAREYHYMQITAALELLPDYPTWDDVEALKVKSHGFGTKSLAKLRELWHTGRIRRVEALSSKPEQVAAETLIKVHGIGRSRAVALAQEGVRSVDELRDRTDLSKQTIICLKYYLELQQPIPRALVAEVEAQVSEVGRKVDERLDAIACGSYRRRKESSHDIDIMLILRGARPGSTEHLDVMGRLIPMLHTAGLLTDDLTDLRTAPASQGKQGAGLSTPSPAQSERVVAYMGICLKGGLHRRIDIRCYPEYQEASALLHFTGSGQFNRFMSRAANDRGFTLSEFGLQPSIKRAPGERVPTGDHLQLHSEAHIFEILQLEYKEPWERRGKLDVVDRFTHQPVFQTSR